MRATVRCQAVGSRPWGPGRGVAERIRGASKQPSWPRRRSRDPGVLVQGPVRTGCDVVLETESARECKGLVLFLSLSYFKKQSRTCDPAHL